MMNFRCGLCNAAVEILDHGLQYAKNKRHVFKTTAMCSCNRKESLTAAADYDYGGIWELRTAADIKQFSSVEGWVNLEKQ